MIQFQELRQACKFLCKQFEIDVKKVRNKYMFLWFLWALSKQEELFKYILEADNDKDGVLDFPEFKVAIKYAQRKLKEAGES